MPGMNIIYKVGGLHREKMAEIDHCLNRTSPLSSCNSEMLFNDANVAISITTYFKSYPFKHFRFDDFQVFIEGYLCGRSGSDITAELVDLAGDFGSHDSTSIKRIGNFVRSVDGEFLIAVYNSKRGTLAVFNDILGRLPVYYCHKEDTLFLSREVKFITGMIPNSSISAHSAAQSLIFFFPLGENTLITEIKKLSSASLLLLRSKDNLFEHHTVHDWNFSANKIQVPAKKYADDLLEPFLQGIKSRVDIFKDRKKIMALSGGLDSRTVLGGLKSIGVEIIPITFVDQRGFALNDVSVAEQLASVYGLKINRFNLPGIDIESMNRLIFMKDGLNASGIMGTVLQSLEIICDHFGDNILFHTGAGGGLILAPRCPMVSIENGNELVNQILYRNTIFAMDDAAAIMRIDSLEFKNRIFEYIHNYPEDELKDKYGHFMIFEHLFNFSFEGDDRERFYFWNSAPFYSTPFFLKAMRLSDASKRNHILFAEFLKKLNPKIASIKYANWGFPITSVITPFYLALKNWFQGKPGLTNLIRRAKTYRQLSAARGKIVTTDHDLFLLKKNIQDMITNRPELHEYLATDIIVKSLPRWNNIYILYNFNNLITYIANLQESVPSLKIDKNG
jgi:asparagine synthase (glutamine-hydrolysing)